MSNKDPFETMLNQSLSQSSDPQLDPGAFDQGIHRKIQARRHKRRTLQGVALVLCIVGVGGIAQLSDGSSPKAPVLEVSQNQNASDPILEPKLQADADAFEMAQWEEDPFEDWSDDMPADYDLVAGI